MKEYDICILGAGIAGLYCARELSKQYPKASICILEKYKFIGGRISTFKHTVSGIGAAAVSWEAGAGRIHSSHHDVLELLKEYKLGLIPIPEAIEYRTADGPTPVDFSRYLHSFSSISQLPPTTLSNSTVKDILVQTLGKSMANELVDRYEYRSELDTLRADYALDILKKELGHHSGFYVVQGGFSGLVAGLKRDVEAAGVKILRQYEASTIEKVSEGSKYRIILKNKSPIHAAKVIVALPRDAVAMMPCFKNLEILKQVKMRPLLRIYALFPPMNGATWFNTDYFEGGLKKFICAKPVRYVIPIDKTKGTMMISYTDGDDAQYWMDRIERYGEAKVVEECVEQLRCLFPLFYIPNPIYFKCHPWQDGCSYWTPGNYDIKVESKKSLQPLPDSMPGVYMCGESWAVKQCWVQSALTSAKDLLDQSIFQIGTKK
jgi:protoporphyrinogen oxidase